MTVEQILTEKKPKRGRKPKAKEEQVVPEAMPEAASVAEGPEPKKVETVGKPMRKDRKK